MSNQIIKMIANCIPLKRDTRIRLLVFLALFFSFCVRLYVIDWGDPLHYQHLDNFHADESKTVRYVKYFPGYFLSHKLSNYTYPNLPKNILSITYQTLDAFVISIEKISNIRLSRAYFNPRLFCRFVTLILGVLTIWLAYRIAVKIGGIHLGLFTIALMNFPSLHVLNSAVVTPDVPSAFFFTLTIYLAQKMMAAETFSRKSLWVLALVAGMAPAVKYTAGISLFVPAIALTYWLATRRLNPASFIVATLIIAAGFVLGFIVFFPGVYLDKHAFSDALQFLANKHNPDNDLDASHLFVFLNRLRRGVFLPVLILALIGLIAAYRRRLYWMMALCGIPAFGYLCITINGFLPRYAILMIPVLSIFAAVAVQGFWEMPRASRPVRIIVATVLVLGHIMTVVQVAQRFSRDTRYGFYEYTMAHLPKHSTIGLGSVGGISRSNPKKPSWTWPRLPPDHYQIVDGLTRPDWMVIVKPPDQKVLRYIKKRKAAGKPLSKYRRYGLEVLEFYDDIVYEGGKKTGYRKKKSLNLKAGSPSNFREHIFSFTKERITSPKTSEVFVVRATRPRRDRWRGPAPPNSQP